MSTPTLDKEMVKAAVDKLIDDDPKFGFELVDQINNKLKRELLDKIIDSNFKEYDAVFKALA